jgi:hypothetical protein
MKLCEVINSLWDDYKNKNYDKVFKETKKWFNRKSFVNYDEILFLLAISNVSNNCIGSKLYWKYFIFGHRYDIFGNNIYKNIRQEFCVRWEELIYKDYNDVNEFLSSFFKELYWKKPYPKQEKVWLHVKGHEWKNYIQFIGELDKVKFNEHYSAVQFYIEDFQKDERFKSGRFTYETSSIYFAKECLIFHLKNTLEQTINEFIDNGRIELIKGKWTSEINLYLELKQYFKDFTVIHQGSPTFLEGQRFDIWIPQLKIAIEYNGIQHYEPVSIFGGIEGYNNTILRDEMKRQKCKNNNVKMIEVREGFDMKELILEIQNSF